MVKPDPKRFQMLPSSPIGCQKSTNDYAATLIAMLTRLPYVTVTRRPHTTQLRVDKKVFAFTTKRGAFL